MYLGFQARKIRNADKEIRQELIHKRCARQALYFGIDFDGHDDPSKHWW
jgi:hypothetical protein